MPTYYENLANNIRAISISNKLDFGDYYNKLSPSKGLCFGLFFMWAQAVLAQDNLRFYRRLGILTKNYGFNAPWLISEIKSFQKKQKKASQHRHTPQHNTVVWMPRIKAINCQRCGHHFGNNKYRCNICSRLVCASCVEQSAVLNLCRDCYQEDLIGSIRPFLDGVLLYQWPAKTSLSHALPSQSYTASRYLVSDQLATKEENDLLNKSLQQIYNFPICGTYTEIAAYILKILKPTIALNIPFVIALESTTHIIGVTYHRQKHKLIFYDANYMSINRLYKIVDFEGIGAEILWSFSTCFGQRYSFFPISARIYISPTINLPNGGVTLQNTYNQINVDILNATTRLSAYVLSHYLYFVCFKGFTAVVRYLLEHSKVDVNKRNRGENTPLHVACIHNRIEVVKILLTHKNLNINLKNISGDTPLALARMSGYTKIAALLENPRAA